MNTKKIITICKTDAKIAPVFSGVFPSDCLPKSVFYPTAFVLNTDPKSKPGTHWVSIYIDGEGRGDYFDSYGKEPPISFKRFLDKNCIQWQYNNRQLQAPLTSVCGQYCILFLHLRCRNVSMQSILSQFGIDLVKNDRCVINFINKKYDVNTELIDIEFIADQICRELV